MCVVIRRKDTPNIKSGSEFVHVFVEIQMHGLFLFWLPAQMPEKERIL